MNSSSPISSMPPEIYFEIAAMLLPTVLPEDFEPAMYISRKSERDVKALTCVNKSFQSSCASVMQQLRVMISSVRVRRFEELKNEYRSLPSQLGTLPMLMDACLSGSDFLKYTQFSHTYAWNTQTEQDIRDMIALDPSLIQYRLSPIRFAVFAQEATPLLTACLNPRCSVEIVELLLENGADPRESYKTLLGQKSLMKIVEAMADRHDQRRIINLLGTLQAYSEKNCSS